MAYGAPTSYGSPQQSQSFQQQQQSSQGYGSNPQEEERRRQQQQQQQSQPQQFQQQQPQQLENNRWNQQQQQPQQSQNSGYGSQQQQPQQSQQYGWNQQSQQTGWNQQEDQRYQSQPSGQKMAWEAYYQQQPQQQPSQGFQQYLQQSQFQPSQPSQNFGGNLASQAPAVQSERQYIGPYAQMIGWQPPKYTPATAGYFESDTDYNARLAREQAGLQRERERGTPFQGQGPQPPQMLGGFQGPQPRVGTDLSNVLQSGGFQGPQPSVGANLSNLFQPEGITAQPPRQAPPSFSADMQRFRDQEFARNQGPESLPGYRPPSLAGLPPSPLTLEQRRAAAAQPLPFDRSQPPPPPPMLGNQAPGRSSPVQAAINNAPPQRTAFAPEPPPPTKATPAPQGVEGFQQWAQTTFGRQASQDELNQIASRVGITDAKNITPQQMAEAQKYATEWAKSSGMQMRTPPAPAPAPAPKPMPVPPPKAAPAPAPAAKPKSAPPTSRASRR